MIPEDRVALLSDVLLGLAKNEPRHVLLRKMLKAIRQHLGMDVSFISQFAGHRRIFRYVDSDLENRPLEEGAGDPLEGSYCQRVVDGRLPELIRDASLLPAARELPVTRALPVGAHLSVPIRLSDGSVYGTFCCFSAQADQSLNERDVALMRVFAELTAEHVERDLAQSNQRREALERIRGVLEGDGLTSVYQPLYDLRSNEVLGFECLSRFPGNPPRSPDLWFAEAARVGLGVELELKAIRRAFGAFTALPGSVYLAANISPPAILAGQVAELLDGLPLARVVLEITEHETIVDYDVVERALQPLRQSGVRIAVDDAGAGYASFRHILRLRPDYIKLDRSLVTHIETDPARRALTTAFIRFAAEIGSKIVAEGVETRLELEALRDLGVAKAQGYYFSKPVPISGAKALLRTWPTPP